MSHTSKDIKTCKCGYRTENRGNFSTHKKRCKLLHNQQLMSCKLSAHRLADKDARIQDKDAQIASLERQLIAKDEQLAAKDDQIADLLHQPRTINNTTLNNTQNNRFFVDASTTLYGKESLGGISPGEIQTLLNDPANAVPKFIQMQYKRFKANKNVRCPNMKRAIYQVVVQNEDGEKQWENRAKGEVLEDLYESNAGYLECEADEDTRHGLRFLNHQDRVKESSAGADGGRRYKEQLDKIHCVIINPV